MDINLYILHLFLAVKTLIRSFTVRFATNKLPCLRSTGSFDNKTKGPDATEIENEYNSPAEIFVSEASYPGQPPRITVKASIVPSVRPS